MKTDLTQDGIKIEYLPFDFIGSGEVKGFEFTKLYCNGNKGSLFQVNTGNSIHYEVLKSVYSPKCIDFANRVYSDIEFVESYPKSNRFGRDAWSFYNFDQAFKKLMSL